jgi:hypothetical protein
MELLGDGILDLDSLDEIVEGFALLFPVPGLVVSLQMIVLRWWLILPFLGRIDEDDARLHAIGINAFDVFLKVSELFHCLTLVSLVRSGMTEL